MKYALLFMLLVFTACGDDRPAAPVLLPHEELQQDYTARAPFYIYYTDWVDHALHKWWQYPENHGHRLLKAPNEL